MVLHSFNHFAVRRFQRKIRMFCRGVKRKYGLDPNHADHLPVLKYTGQTGETDLRVYAWGMAETGALGIPNFLRPAKKSRHQAGLPFIQRPTRHGFAERNIVKDVAAGYGFSLYVVKDKNNNKLYGTGLNSDGQIGYHTHKGRSLELIIEPTTIELPLRKDNTNIIKVAAGRAHSLALSDNEGAFSLGSNAYGQCGRLILEDEVYGRSPVVHNIPDVEGEQIRDVVCGQDHSLFISCSGQAFACGWGADGQTGQLHYDNTAVPSPVRGDVEKEKITKCSTTVDTVLALNDNGEVFGWGNSEYCQFSSVTQEQQLSVSRHIPLPGVSGRILDIAASGTSCLVLNDAGEVWVWGFGILGLGPEVSHSQHPIKIPSSLFGFNELSRETRVKAVGAGISHLYAITSSGDLYVWGKNKYGCLGLGKKEDQYFPLKVSLPAVVKKASFGVDHSLALCKGFVSK